MSATMQKRQPRRAVNAQGDHIGGQFARSERANDLILQNAASVSVSPYPTKKRQVTMRLGAAQTTARPLSKAPAVRVKKDPNTGFWEAETPYCNPQSGYAMEKLRGGLTGDESEIAGYYAQVAAELCNQGLVDISDPGQIASVQTGVATAAACLGLPGGWGEIKNSAKSASVNKMTKIFEMQGHADTDVSERYLMMLCWGNLLGGKFFDNAHGTPSISPYGPRGQLPSEVDGCSDYFRVAYKPDCGNSLPEQEMLVWATAFQTSAQHFLRNMPISGSDCPDAEFPGGESSPKRVPFSTSYLSPETVIAGASLQAMSGAIPLGEGEQNKKLFKWWIDNSESEQVSHIFDSETIGKVVYHDPGQLASRMNQDWHLRLPIDFDPVDLKWMTEADRYLKKAMQPQEAYKKVAHSPDFSFDEYAIKSKPGDRFIRQTFSKGMPVKERHFEFMRHRVVIPGFSVGSDHQLIPGSSLYFRGYAGSASADYLQLTANDLVPKLCLALHTIATLRSGDTARQKAEQFISETNAQPLVATLLARSLVDATPNDTNYVNWRKGHPLYREKVAASHQRLVLRAAQAWHDFEHDSSVYALPGGRLDPEVMLKQAQQLPMTGSVT